MSRRGIISGLVPSGAPANNFDGSFNGSNQYGSLADGTQTNLDTIGFFRANVTLDTVSGTRYFLTKKNTATNGGWRIGVSIGFIIVQFEDTSGNLTYYLTSTAMTGADIGVEYEWMVNIDPSASATNKIEIFKDNVSQSLTVNSDASSSIGATTDDVLLGAIHASGTPAAFMDGLINNVTVHTSTQDATARGNITGVVDNSGVLSLLNTNANLVDSSSEGNDFTNNNSITFPSR